MNVFQYGIEPHARKHGPCGYAHYKSYLPWLRDECSFLCVYCLKREQWGVIRRSFDIDHFVPQVKNPAAVLDYDNLLYACAACNAAKGDRDLPDPFVALVRQHIQVNQEGVIETQSSQSREIVDMLGLNDRMYIEYRKLWSAIIELAEKHNPQLFQQLMGFPDNLPDLSKLRPPGGNSRPEGVKNSFFAIRERGELPEVY